jgi:GAF domain-containing protein
MEKKDVTFDELRCVLICDLDRINRLITAAWEVVNSHHNISVDSTERLNFEITLITPSLDDEELTIASWCNRDNFRPKSLLLKTAGEKNIYSRTEAAKMIDKRVTRTRVIEDTAAPTENYEALYDDQKARIRSSVLHPILSPKSEHLAVLVLHCDRTGFFRVTDERYWRELFLVFAPSIALELERIKAFNKATLAWPTPPIEMYKPY